MACLGHPAPCLGRAPACWREEAEGMAEMLPRALFVMGLSTVPKSVTSVLPLSFGICSDW